MVRIEGRNPLTGLSGLQLKKYDGRLHWGAWSRNPLTGLSGLQPDPEFLGDIKAMWSQSPYGAKWSATQADSAGPDGHYQVAIPLRG